IGIGYGLHYMVKNKYHRGFILNVALIFAGAMGNIIDSTFYGVIFNESTFYDRAVLFPESGGYSSLFHGKVVDMLYFPVIERNFPDWLPIWGGAYSLVFRPAFSLAESARSVAVDLFWWFEERFLEEG